MMHTYQLRSFAPLHFSNETDKNAGAIGECVKGMCFIFYLPVIIVMTIANAFFSLISYFGLVASLGFAVFAFTAFFTIAPHPLFIVAGVVSLCIAGVFFSMMTAAAEGNKAMNEIFFKEN